MKYNVNVCVCVYVLAYITHAKSAYEGGYTEHECLPLFLFKSTK